MYAVTQASATAIAPVPGAGRATLVNHQIAAHARTAAAGQVRQDGEEAEEVHDGGRDVAAIESATSTDRANWTTTAVTMRTAIATRRAFPCAAGIGDGRAGDCGHRHPWLSAGDVSYKRRCHRV